MPKTLSQIIAEAEEKFDKLKIFSAPIPDSIDGVHTFVVDIQEVKAFLAQAITSAVTQFAEAVRMEKKTEWTEYGVCCGGEEEMDGYNLAIDTLNKNIALFITGEEV